MGSISEQISCEINFFEEDIRYALKGKKKTREWLRSSIENEGKNCGELNIIFCSDEFLHRINVEYLDHDTYTDIITFNMSESDNIISGDIFISVERARDNARIYKVPLYSEISRLAIHGILHLSGYDDANAAEKAEMRRKEDYYLSLRP